MGRTSMILTFKMDINIYLSTGLSASIVCQVNRSEMSASVLLTLLFLTTACAVAANRSPSFRCLRPFDALTSFAPRAMLPEENCDFNYFTVTDAAVALQCTDGADESYTGRSAGCYATFSSEWTAKRAMDDPAQLLFRISLRAINDSVVSYNGHDGEGYSVCCAFFDSDHAQCEWKDLTCSETGRAEKSLEIRRCAMASVAPHDGRLKGSVTKPLHRLVVGQWIARMTIFERQRALGVVQAAFWLNTSDVERTSASKDHEAPDGHVVAVHASP